MRAFGASLCLLLAACTAPPPELDSRISPQARAADFPALAPLGPFLDVDALLPEDRGQIGLTLEARAADLRRRAAELQALPVN